MQCTALGAVAIAIGCSVALTGARAEEPRELGAHQHGVGHFNIAFEGGQVAMELEAPGADIVGFEHAAETDADRAAIEAARARLADALSLFVLSPEAGCTLVSADVALIAEGGDHDDHDHEEHGHDDHDDDKHGHDDHAHDDHDKDGHDEHAHDDHSAEHDDDHAEEAEAGHTEFHAEYRLSCADPERLDAIRFAYFEAFPNAEELEVQMIGATGSHGFEVTREAPEIRIPGSS